MHVTIPQQISGKVSQEHLRHGNRIGNDSSQPYLCSPNHTTSSKAAKAQPVFYGADINNLSLSLKSNNLWCIPLPFPVPRSTPNTEEANSRSIPLWLWLPTEAPKWQKPIPLTWICRSSWHDLRVLRDPFHVPKTETPGITRPRLSNLSEARL